MQKIFLLALKKFARARNYNAYMRDYMRERYKRRREALFKMLGGKCSVCGDKKGPFHFDHINAKKKTFRIADINSVSDEKLEKETNNLQILCVKCHKEKSKENGDYRKGRK